MAYAKQQTEDYEKWPLSGKHTVVKVQISIVTTGLKQRALIYNQTRTLEYEFDAEKALLTLMGGRKKAFFTANYIPDKPTPNKYKIKLRARVTDRNW